MAQQKCKCGECIECLRNKVQKLERTLRKRTEHPPKPGQTIRVSSHYRRNRREPVDTKHTEQAAKQVLNNLGGGFLKGLLGIR